MMKWLTSYRQHVSGEKPIALLLLILKVFRRFRLICFGLAALILGCGVWTALTVDLKSGASMGLILFPGAAIFISIVGVCAYGVAQLFLSPSHRDN